MLTVLLRFVCSFLGVVLTAVAALATVVAACVVASMTYVYWTETHLSERDVALWVRSAAVVPVGALLTWAGVRLANGASRQKLLAPRASRAVRSQREQAVTRVCLAALWITFVSAWAWNHLPGDPGWRACRVAGLLALVFAAMHGRILLHEAAHLFAGRLCGLKPLGVRIGLGPALWRGETRDGFRWDWRLWPSIGWAEVLHFDERSYRWRQFCMVAAGPLADALFVAGGWWLVTGPGREMASRELLTPAGGLAPDGLLIVLAFYLVFAGSILGGLLPQRFLFAGRLFHTDGWWLARVFFLPAAAVRQHFLQQKCGYAMRQWLSGRREAALEELAEVRALFPEREVAVILLESRLHEQSKEPAPAAACFRQALAQSGELAPAERLAVLTEHAAILAATLGAEHARQIGAALLEKAMTTDERVGVLDALACLPILHGGTLALLPDAERWCAEALALAPDRVTLRGTWGALLVELGREAEAVPILEEVLASTASDHDRGIGSFYLALATLRLGRRREMRRHRQQTLRWCKVPALLARIPVELPAA